MKKFYFAAIAMFAVTTAVMADDRPSIQGGVNVGPSGQVSGSVTIRIPLMALDRRLPNPTPTFPRPDKWLNIPINA
jgi:hypothetical protein